MYFEAKNNNNQTKSNGRQVDMVLVYEEPFDERERDMGDFDENDARRRYFEANLKKEGLEVDTERVHEADKSTVAVKVHAPWIVLCKHAEELHIKMPLKVRDSQTKFKKRTLRGTKVGPKKKDQGANTARVFEPATGSVDHQKEGDQIIYWPFKRKHVDRYDVVDRDTFFAERQRIEIVWEILQKTPNDAKDPKKRGIESLLEHKIYETVYALHDGDLSKRAAVPTAHMTSRQKLKLQWASWSTIWHHQPLLDVRNYFGEKIGFYFAFMECYTLALIFPSLVGLITFIYGLFYAMNHRELDFICNSSHHAAAHSSDSHSDDHVTGAQHDEMHVTPSSSGDAHHDSSDSSSLESDRHATSGALDFNSFKVADLWMCPICEPPSCEAWEMYEEGCFQYQWSFRLDNEASIILSCAVIFWAIIFLKLWRRRESKLAVDWNTHDAEEHSNSIIRPSYEERAPTQHNNPITLETEPFVPLSKKFMWMFVSVMITVSILLVASLCLLALVISRIQLYKAFKQVGGAISTKNVELSRWGVHGLIFVMVSIFESFYHWMAHKLTEYECPKTEHAFMSSLLWKIFIFELMNDFIPIAYAAWVKGKVRTPQQLNFMTELCDGGCIGEVTELVAVLLLLRLVVGNTMEVGLPFLKNTIKSHFQRKDDDGDETRPRWQQDLHLEECELDGVYDEYMEMMIQFLFIVFFSCALPVAPFLCFLNNIVEIRVDAINMLQAHRRPLPIRVPGIQIWNSFMEIIVKLGVICNAALIAFTSDNVPRLYYKFIHSPGHGVLGYTRFSLSKVPISVWPESQRSQTMKANNLTECYYPDWRSDEEPFDERNEYWQIFTLRVAAFAAFVLIFFIIMWFINTFISDMPHEARTKIKRRVYVVGKALEAESTHGGPKRKKTAQESATAAHRGDVVETDFA